MPVKEAMKLFTLAMALFIVPAAAAMSVHAEAGNLVLVDDAGNARSLTSGGTDAAPVLSPDGRHVAFIRRGTAAPVDAGPGAAESNQLWLVDAGGAAPRLLVDAHAEADPRRVLAGLGSPVFSPDGGTVYFLSTAWATSEAVHAVDLADGRERFVVPGNSVDVMPAGEYAGDLVVNQHRYWLAGGSYDWFWLFAPDGSDQGPVGPDDEDVARFKAQQYAR